jgi:hypothetical protein
VIRGSTVPREIQLEEKRVCVPTPMVAKPFFSIPAAVTPMAQGNVVAEGTLRDLKHDSWLKVSRRENV